MSSMMRQNTRGDYPNLSGVFRRVVNLPRNIVGGVSRALEQGFDLIGISERRNQLYSSPPPAHYPPSPHYYPLGTPVINDEWAFLNNFEQFYGTTHPFFYACRFIQAMKIAQDEKKLLFLYLHSPNHPFAAEFCRETLCSEVVVQFLDANFVCWGAICDIGEGVQMSGVLRPDGFPFCAVVAPADGDNIAVLQQMEGPVAPVDLLETLQSTLEEQGVIHGSGRAKEEEKRRADSELIEEQDIAYLLSLSLDQYRERLNKTDSDQTVQNPVSATPASGSNTEDSDPPDHCESLIRRSRRSKANHGATTKTKTETLSNETGSKTQPDQDRQILVRFPNGERRERSFSSRDKVEAIYAYIDSLCLPGIKNYRLISSYPRKVFGTNELGMTLKDAGLCPRASLFLELS